MLDTFSVAMSFAVSFGVAILIAIILYWQLIVAEGTYLGQGVVTLLYDLAARQYNKIKQFDRRVESTFLGAPLARALNGNHAASILDIGTGTGRLALTILEQPSFQGRVIGIDASLPMLRVASTTLETFRERVTLIWRDASNLPFESNSFDVVTCLEMLEFTPSPKRQVEEAFRVMQPGGMLLVTRRRGVDAWLIPGKTHRASAFERLLTQTGLERIERQVWQVDYDLYWARKPGSYPAGSKIYIELLRCTVCGTRQLFETSDALTCSNCTNRFPLTSGIVDMR